jgi:hypothetical protein
MHIGRIQIVFFIPCSSRQNDVAIQTSGTHAEIQHSQQIKLAFGGFFTILNSDGLTASSGSSNSAFCVPK